ncbi:MAG TPA: UbiA family prenyltransferase [Planctomycetota bacterium]|nr:UbiA family prenyltransferase [Planctomycetota bacterium]
MIAYLRLVRLPNVFTAVSDILAGYAIMRALHGLHDGPGYDRLVALCGASACLYMSGMAFNDIADREEDAQTRPNRPLPSGQVKLAGAIVCAVTLMAGGIALAAVASLSSVLRAALLSAAILKYDFGSKHNILMGPLMLGLCRFLNVQLGMSASMYFASTVESASFGEAPWGPAFAVGIYAAGITAFSAQEEEGRKTGAILLGWLLCVGGIILAGVTTGPLAWVLLAPLALILLHFTRRLRKTGTPQAAKNLVRTGVMGICVIDCAMVLGVGARMGEKNFSEVLPFAVGCLLLLIPGLLLGKALQQKEA